MLSGEGSRLSGFPVALAARGGPARGAVIPRGRQNMGVRFARSTAPREFDASDCCKQWGLPLPDQSVRLGFYIVEFNAKHASGLNGVQFDFLALHQTVVQDASMAAVPAAAPTPLGWQEPVQIPNSFSGTGCSTVNDQKWFTSTSPKRTKSVRSNGCDLICRSRHFRKLESDPILPTSSPPLNKHLLSKGVLK